ncbi:MAG: 4Fe-4S binding protein [Clostridia bacterium]|nr:4Fe-4S binding protein [Clostridia bacterium]
MKPSLNDVGIEGCRAFSFDSELCRGCKRCLVAEGCPSGAVSLYNGKAVVDASACTKCGVCVGKCPFGAVPKEAESRVRVFVGGTWGKKQRIGTLLPDTYAPEQIPEIVEKIILWYKENGLSKERLGAAIDRLGEDALICAIKGDGLLKRKEEILNA